MGRSKSVSRRPVPARLGQPASYLLGRYRRANAAGIDRISRAIS